MSRVRVDSLNLSTLFILLYDTAFNLSPKKKKKKKKSLKKKPQPTELVLEANSNFRTFQPEGLELDRAYEKESKKVESIFNCRQHYISAYNIRVGSDSPKLTRKTDIQTIKQIFLPSISVSTCCI